MHLRRLGEAERFAREPLDAGTQGERLAFNLLRGAFARYMSCGSQMPDVRPPMIGEEPYDPKGVPQGLELEEYLVLAPAKYLRQDLAGPVIKGMPQPAWLVLRAHAAPHFVDLRSLHAVNAHLSVLGS